MVGCSVFFFTVEPAESDQGRWPDNPTRLIIFMEGFDDSG